TGEENRSLSRGVPPADEDHVLSPAAPSLDGRGPVGDPAALEIVQRRDRRTTVARTRGDDDGARGDGPPIFEHEGEWGSLGFARMTGEPGCNGGHGEIGSELLGLGETAPGELLAGDSDGKAEVVLDACAGARLTPEAPTVEDLVRMAAADKEFLERPHPGIGGRTNENRAAKAERERNEPAEGEGAEDTLAELDLGHQQGPETLRREQQCLHRAAGLDVHQGIGSRELSHLADKLTPPSTLPDGDTAPERIAPAEGHPTGEKHEHPRSRLPHLEQHRSIRVGAALPEAGCPGNIGLVHWGEDLVESPFQV